MKVEPLKESIYREQCGLSFHSAIEKGFSHAHAIQTFGIVWRKVLFFLFSFLFFLLLVSLFVGLGHFNVLSVELNSSLLPHSLIFSLLDQKNYSPNTLNVRV